MFQQAGVNSSQSVENTLALKEKILRLEAANCALLESNLKLKERAIGFYENLI